MMVGRCQVSPSPGVKCALAAAPVCPAFARTGSSRPTRIPPSQPTSHCMRRASSGASSISASGMNLRAPKAILIPPAAMQTSKTTMPIRSALQGAICRRPIQSDMAAIETPAVNSPISG